MCLWSCRLTARTEIFVHYTVKTAKLNKIMHFSTDTDVKSASPKHLSP